MMAVHVSNSIAILSNSIAVLAILSSDKYFSGNSPLALSQNHNCKRGTGFSVFPKFVVLPILPDTYSSCLFG